jgi:DNA topoisomerase VI subunit B
VRLRQDDDESITPEVRQTMAEFAREMKVFIMRKHRYRYAGAQAAANQWTAD